MPTFILMTKLAPGTLDSSEVRKSTGKEWLHKVRACCPDVKWVAHYALLGRYDFMDIYEAPDVETAQKVSLISRAGGALEAESWQALPYDNFLRVLDEITD